MSQQQFQDWTPVVIRKKRTSESSNKDTNTITVPKNHTNKQNNLIKVQKLFDSNNLEEEPETRPVIVSKEFGQKIQQARMERGLSQKQLANALNLQQSIINEYERGCGVHNGNYIGKIKSYLGIK